MKALIRDNEIIPEDQWNYWIRKNLDWMITERPNGDGYKLVEDFTPEIEPEISGDPLNI